MRPSLKLLRKKKSLVGVEVGVSNGINAKIILEKLDMKSLYLVDIWKSYIEDGQRVIQSSRLKEDCEQNLKGFKQVVFIQNRSVQAAKRFEGRSLDFVYIDANHQYKSVKADIKAWLPKIKMGGMLAGHDYGKEDVQKAVKELLKEHTTDRGDWWIIK